MKKSNNNNNNNVIYIGLKLFKNILKRLFSLLFVFYLYIKLF